MRIRKHAKISPLLYAASSQPHVCQLNQSPWDAMSFSPPPPPPPPSQANGTDISAGDGSCVRRLPVVESYRELNTWRQSEFPSPMEEEDRSPAPPQITLCCKTDGKNWQCRREASKGNSLCDHHLSLLKSYSSVPTKKSIKPTGEALPPRRPQLKKGPASSSSSANSYEFYYYSGFGPRWGKKRGETAQNSRPAKNGIEESVDYVEYEDDDEDEEEGNIDNGRKRMRKPIKARSLKSLM